MVLGSIPAAVGAALLIAGLAAVAVPFEERVLAKKFGLGYEEYRARVPRWVGRVRA